MKLNLGDPEAMVGPPVTAAPVPSPLSELQGGGDGNEVDGSVDEDEMQEKGDDNKVKGSDDDNGVQESGDGDEEEGSDDGELDCISLEDSSLPFVVQLQKLNEVLCRAMVSHARGKGIQSIYKLCGILRGVIQRATDDGIAAGALSQETSSTCEYLLMILSSPKQLSVISVAMLLRSLCQLIGVNTGSNTWLTEGYMQHTEVNSRTNFKDQFRSMCSELLNYLKDIVPDLVIDDEYNVIMVKQEAFSEAVDDLYKFACWGLSYYGSSPELAVVRDSLGKLQENVWERLIDARYVGIAFMRIGAAMQAMNAPPTDSGNKTLFSLKWLVEKNIVWKIMDTIYDMDDVPEVTQFLTILGKNEVVVEENNFLKRLRLDYYEDEDEDQHNAADQIDAHMLEVLDISTFSDNFLKFVLGWLETRQANSRIDGLRIFNILRKLLKNDKNKRWEKRFCTLFRKCATSVSNSDLVECLKEVADHYNTSHHGSGSSEDSFLQKGDEQTKLLQACSSADVVTCIAADIASGALNHSKVYIQKAETWKEKEINLDVHINSSSKLTETLSTTFPNFRHETAKKCLERLILAKQLSSGLNPNKSNTFASVIATAMSPELQALEALKNESLLHCKVVQQVEELSEKHIREYDALREKQHQKLVKFAEACHKEKEDVVWDALYGKAKALAIVERTYVGKDKDISSADILKRLLLNAGGACKEIEVKLSQTEVKLSQVENKHRESLDRLPNAECTVCCSEFSKKRKRACLDPCGHASACVDCATQEWKRTKKCFLCNTSIEKPIGVPFKLFF